ncbi:hypothetical protein D3C76_1735540 [compost metagenome]
MALGNPSYAHRRLAAQGLGIEASLAGHHQVRALHQSIQASQFGHNLHTRAELRAHECPGREAHATGSTTTWVVPHILTQQLRTMVGKMP